MEISLEWLREFVEVPDTGALVAGLARAGIEVDELRDPAQEVRAVVVGEVLSCEPHPRADKIRICQVTDGKERFTIVCGASNVAAGQRVAFAKLGATLPGLTITRRIIEMMGEDISYTDWLVRFGSATDDAIIEKSHVYRDKTFDIRLLARSVTVTTIARFPYDYFMPPGERAYLIPA